jgi:hypothetical protein
MFVWQSEPENPEKQEQEKELTESRQEAPF